MRSKRGKLVAGAVPRLLLAAFALLGLFAMHGLASHGTDAGALAGAASAPLSLASHNTDTHDTDADAHAASSVAARAPVTEYPGLADAPGATAHAPSAVSVTAASVTEASHADTCPCDGERTHAGSQSEGGGHHGGHSLAIGLCLALLVTAFALLLAGSRLRTWAVRDRGESPGRARLTALAALARPPDLTALGVCRC